MSAPVKLPELLRALADGRFAPMSDGEFDVFQGAPDDATICHGLAGEREVYAIFSPSDAGQGFETYEEIVGADRAGDRLEAWRVTFDGKEERVI